MIYIFDIDGTLVNSKLRHSVLLKDILIEYGKKIPVNFEDDYIKSKCGGLSTKNYLSTKLGFDDGLSQKIATEWVEKIENEEYLMLDELYDDCVPTLERLFKNNKIYFLSSRSQPLLLKQELIHFDIMKYADKLLISIPGEGASGKAKYIKKLKDENADEEILVIGDTEIDYKAAISANVRYYILNRGFRNCDYWNNCNVQSYDSLYRVS